MGICCTILTPVCLACHDFLLRHTARRNGSRAGIPRAEATTANARAVVFLTVEVSVTAPRQTQDCIELTIFVDMVDIWSHRRYHWEKSI